jgi:hypothetical protein
MTETIDAAAAVPPSEDFVASLNAASAAKDPTAFAAVCTRVAASVPRVAEADGLRNTCHRIPGLLVVELHRMTGHRLYTLVDDTEPVRSILRQYRVSSRAGYAVCGVKVGGRATHRFLHAMIHGIAPGDCQIDHVDRIKSDNRGANIRAIAASANAINRPQRTDNHSGRTGVCREERDRLWVATWSTAEHVCMRKRFPDAKHGGREGAYQAACAKRAAIEATLAHYVGSLVYSPAAAAPPTRSILAEIEPFQSKHSNEVAGLCRYEARRQWRATWKDPSTGKTTTRTFSDSVHGGTGSAKAKAVACLHAAATAPAEPAADDAELSDAPTEPDESGDGAPPAKRPEMTAVPAPCNGCPAAPANLTAGQ